MGTAKSPLIWLEWDRCSTQHCENFIKESIKELKSSLSSNMIRCYGIGVLVQPYNSWSNFNLYFQYLLRCKWTDARYWGYTGMQKSAAACSHSVRQHRLDLIGPHLLPLVLAAPSILQPRLAPIQQDCAKKTLDLQQSIQTHRFLAFILILCQSLSIITLFSVIVSLDAST